MELNGAIITEVQIGPHAGFMVRHRRNITHHMVPIRQFDRQKDEMLAKIEAEYREESANADLLLTQEPDNPGRISISGQDEEDWHDAQELPPSNKLIRVEYASGGYYIAHGNFFGSVWDLISRWQIHDQSEALRRSFEPRTESEDLYTAEEPKAQPIRYSQPAPGTNLSFEF